MVKALVTALVCGTFFVTYTSAQEVFNGTQKAKPKYPKAEVAKTESKSEKSVTPAGPKAEAAQAHAVASAQKVESNAAHKTAAASSAKSSKPAVEVSLTSKTAPKTVTKATPTVMPGQRAPAATPSPIVKPEPPLIAKTQTAAKQSAQNSKSSPSNPRVPLAAVPPPSKVAQAKTKPTSKPATVEIHSQPAVETATASKASTKEIGSTVFENPPAASPALRHTTVAKASGDVHGASDSNAPKTGKGEPKTPAVVKASPKTPQKSPPVVAKAAVPSEQKKSSIAESHGAVAPPAEGPTHDVVMPVRKSSFAQTRPAKPAVVVKTVTPATKSGEDEEEDTTVGARISAKPAVAVVSTIQGKKTLPQARELVDAHALSGVPGSLQTRREASGSGVTKVSLVPSSSAESVIPSPTSDHFETAFTKLADGFDFPVGRPDAQGYYRARGFRSHGHLGEDWDGVGGGDTDLGDPIFVIADGLVVFARDCHMGWGNVIIVRHSYREGGAIRTIDSLYGHLNSILVRKGQAVSRGQKIATMGTAHGLYDAHLHLEIRKNIEIGMSRAAFAQDFSNYYDPSVFIQAHRHLQNGGGNYRVAMNTFTRDSRIRWDKVRNYSHAHTGGGTSQSAAALKRALAAKNE